MRAPNDRVATIDEIEEYLSSHPWLRAPDASENSYRFNLMCEAGLDFVGDESLPPEQRIHFTGEYPERLIELASEGDLLAHEALCAVADHLTGKGMHLPITLQMFVVAAAGGGSKKRRGRHRVTLLHRNDAIFHAVELATSQGFRATRNEGHSDNHQSGCSIVAEQLERLGMAMSERAVQSIWTKVRDARRQAGFIIKSDVAN